MSSAAGLRVVASDGRRYTLGELLKSGGAGAVYRVREASTLVAKLYHPTVDCAVYERKVQAMLTLSPDLPELVEGGKRYVQIAWPTALLRDERGRFLGYLMPAVDVDATSELECVMQEKQARSLGLPTGLGAKVTLAANLSAMIAELHRRKHRVVDLKPVNVRFYPASLYLAMLDCDGFSIQGEGERFPAPQFTTDYLAPEFQATGLNVPGEEQQDRFALAVIVFQLLNFGIHPYSGRPASDRVPTDIPGRIAGRFYAYGLQPHAQIQPNPASGHEAMPADLRQLFDRAFQGPGAARPSPLEWAALLRGYAQRANMRLAACTRDSTHQHFAGLPCGACARAQLIAGAASRSGQAARRGQVPPRPFAAARQQAPAPRPVRGWAAPGMRLPPLTQRVVIPGYPPRVPFYPPKPKGSGANGIVAVVAFILVFVWSSVFNHGGSRHRSPQRNRPAPDVRPYTYSGSTPLPEPPPPPAPEVQAATGDLAPIASVDDRSQISYALAEARELVHAVAIASNAQNLPNRDRGLAGLARLASRHGKPAAPYGNARVRWLDFMQSAAKASEQEHRQSLAELGPLIQSQPYDAEPVCEWAWLALVVDHRDFAEDAFVRAIWAQPSAACGWYGLGVAAQDDALRIGALAMATMADNLEGSFSSDSQLQADFTRRMMVRAGLDFDRFRILQARGLRNSLNAHGQSAPPQVQQLANQPLPPAR